MSNYFEIPVGDPLDSDRCVCSEVAQAQCWEWSDCRKDGHEEGCYVVHCIACGYYSADCQEGIRV